MAWLEIMITDLSLKAALTKAMAEVGAKRLLGAAPAGGLEDSVQKYLDNTEK